MSQPQNTPPPPEDTPKYYSDTSFPNTTAIINNNEDGDEDDDEYEQQQLISDLLSSSASSTCSSSPSETTSFPFHHQVKFVSYPYFLPFESSSSSYVTINGNEETCGSSFSDTDSSVMASFDTTASFHISHASSISRLFQNSDDNDNDNDDYDYDFDFDLIGGHDVTLKSRDLDGVWDWTVFLPQHPTTPTR